MCDYSLHHVATRPAKVEDHLVTTSFGNSITRGFAAVGEPRVAVCLLPGTEVAFERNVECEPVLGQASRAQQRVAGGFCESDGLLRHVRRRFGAAGVHEQRGARAAKGGEPLREMRGPRLGAVQETFGCVELAAREPCSGEHVPPVPGVDIEQPSVGVVVERGKLLTGPGRVAVCEEARAKTHPREARQERGFMGSL